MIEKLSSGSRMELGGVSRGWFRDHGEDAAAVLPPAAVTWDARRSNDGAGEARIGAAPSPRIRSVFFPTSWPC